MSSHPESCQTNPKFVRYSSGHVGVPVTKAKWFGTCIALAPTLFKNESSEVARPACCPAAGYGVGRLQPAAPTPVPEPPMDGSGLRDCSTRNDVIGLQLPDTFCQEGAARVRKTGIGISRARNWVTVNQIEVAMPHTKSRVAGASIHSLSLNEDSTATVWRGPASSNVTCASGTM